MSSSDPTSNFDSLNVSSEPIDIPAAVGEASSQRSNRSASSTPRRARSKSLQGQGQGRHDMSQVIKSQRFMTLVGTLLLFQLVVGLVQTPNHRSCLRIFLPVDPQTSIHNTFEYHNQRAQQVNVGVDPMVFSTVVSEARLVIQESEEKSKVWSN